MDEVEEVLRKLGDAGGLFQLGSTHYYDEDFERASRVMHLVADLYRGADTPESLARAAQTLSNLGFALAGWGRPQPDVEAAYREAAAAGREAAIPEGLVLTAQTLFNLGFALAGWGRPEQEVEAAYRESAAAGREAATPEGRVLTAQALLHLGFALAGWGRPQPDVEAAYREAAAAGREAATPEGRRCGRGCISEFTEIRQRASDVSTGLILRAHEPEEVTTGARAEAVSLSQLRRRLSSGDRDSTAGRFKLPNSR